MIRTIMLLARFVWTFLTITQILLYHINVKNYQQNDTYFPLATTYCFFLRESAAKSQQLTSNSSQRPATHPTHATLPIAQYPTRPTHLIHATGVALAWRDVMRCDIA